MRHSDDPLTVFAARPPMPHLLQSISRPQNSATRSWSDRSGHRGIASLEHAFVELLGGWTGWLVHRMGKLVVPYRVLVVGDAAVSMKWDRGRTTNDVPVPGSLGGGRNRATFNRPLEDVEFQRP